MTTPDLDAVRAMVEGVTTLSSRIRTRPGYLHPIEIAVSEVASEVVFLGQGDFSTIGEIAATARVDMDKAADAIDALAAEVEALRHDNAALEARAEALTEMVALTDELCTAVDCEAEDIGGQRKSITILRELGQRAEKAKVALSQKDTPDA